MGQRHMNATSGTTRINQMGVVKVTGLYPQENVFESMQ